MIVVDIKRVWQTLTRSKLKEISDAKNFSSGTLNIFKIFEAKNVHRRDIL